MFCQVEPSCQIVFYVVSREVCQRVPQNCFAIFKNKLLLNWWFSTLHQRSGYLLFQSLSSQPLRKTPRFFFQPRMPKKFLIFHPLLGIRNKHLPDEVLSKLTNLLRKDNTFIIRIDDLPFSKCHFFKERISAKKHLISNNPETPNITFLIISLAIKNLRSHGDIRPHPRSQKFLILKFGKPKISQFNFKILGNQNVPKFQIPMHHLVLPDLLEGIPQLNKYPPDLLLR